MRSSRANLMFTLAAGGLVIGSSLVTGLAQADTAAANGPSVTRIFYLQGMEPRIAMRMLRSQLDVRNMAAISGHSLVVVSDTADRVDQSEMLLRQRNAVVRTSDPHKPLDLNSLGKSPFATRVFRVAGDNLNNVVTVLRSIYHVREVNESAENHSVSVTAAKPVLDSSESLLRELSLIAKPTAGSGS